MPQTAPYINMDFTLDSAPHWFCFQGMSLLGSASSIFTGTASGKLADMAGIDPNLLTEQLSCFYPLPLLGEDALTEPLAKHVTNYEMLRHPIFWLYGTILQFQMIPADPRIQKEAHLEWEAEAALRIAAQLEISRIYDHVTGAWRDVAEMLGLDFSDPWVQRRIRAWQKGAADELLDNFNIGTIILDSVETENIVEVSSRCFSDVFFLSSLSSVYSLNEFLSEIDESSSFEDISSAIPIAVSVLVEDADVLFITQGLEDGDADNTNSAALEKLEQDMEEQEATLIANRDIAGFLAFKDRVLALVDLALDAYAEEADDMTKVMDYFKQWVEEDDESGSDA